MMYRKAIVFHDLDISVATYQQFNMQIPRVIGNIYSNISST